MNWYEYSQNNSGGVLVYDDKVCHRVYIQAESDAKADEIAISLGIYFGGVSDGRDCECCGDRWYESPSALKFPIKWDERETIETIEEYAQKLATEYNYANKGEADSRAYYADGTVKEFYK